jgi:hypothetical protein
MGARLVGAPFVPTFSRFMFRHGAEPPCHGGGNIGDIDIEFKMQNGTIEIGAKEG